MCISFVAVILVLPLLGLILIRNEGKLARDRSPADGLMDGLGDLVGWIVDRVVHWPVLTTLVALVAVPGVRRRPICSSSRAIGWPTRCPTASRRWARPAASTRS